MIRAAEEEEEMATVTVTDKGLGKEVTLLTLENY